MILHLFVDTNLFIQCNPLPDLDWGRFGSFEKVQLIVCRPIQAEIDAQKDRGEGRVGNRARVASSLLREILRSPDRTKIMKESAPPVELVIRQTLRPDAAHADVLDYNYNDDALVGIASTFKRDTPGGDVRVLTYDTGPMASADAVGLPFLEIPEEWRLPPESDNDDRKLKAALNEVSRLQKAEPSFEITFTNAGEKVIGQLNSELTYFPRLTDTEISELISRISKEFPERTTFEPPPKDAKRTYNIGVLAAMAELVNTPPSPQQISRYNEDYQKWTKQCEALFRTFHSELYWRRNPQDFVFNIKNIGTRPGESAMVHIKAAGSFKIVHPDRDDTEPSKLSAPPKAPTNGGKYLSVIMGIEDAAQLDPFGFNRNSSLALPSLYSPKKHDPEKFYFKEGKANKPITQVAWKCDLWRHGIAAEPFDLEIWVREYKEKVEGALICEVRAANLSHVASLTIPVRFDVVLGSTLTEAHSLITQLSRSAASN